VTEPIASVQTYLDAFNAGDVDAMAAQFATSGTILDGMAPHSWVGPTAARDWYTDVLTEGAHVGASNYHVTVGEPVHNAVTGDAAYVVLPACMTFELKGVTQAQTGAYFTVALRLQDDGWRIVSWAWTKGRAT
jgi:ketosteroid isomerase-like protein